MTAPRAWKNKDFFLRSLCMMESKMIETDLASPFQNNETHNEKITIMELKWPHQTTL